MQQITKQKYFFYLAFMLIASTYLRLVFNNLPPVIRSQHLWAIIWVISLLIFNSKVFLDKSMVFLLVYGLLMFLATETIWASMDDWNKKLLFDEVYQIGIGLSVITYFRQSQDYIRLAKIAKWAIIFLFITAIMSIISSAIDPMYARNITAAASIINAVEIESLLNIKRYGGGTYGTASVFMCLFPILIYYYKYIKLSLISRNLIIIISVILFVALLGMQIFGNILVATVFSVIALFGMKKIRQSILVIGLFFSITMIVPKEMYVNGLLSVSDYFEQDSDLNLKIKDLALFIETRSVNIDNSTGVGGRAERYPLLMKTFVESPLLGCYFFSDNSGNGYKAEGAHLYWMNKLTVTGIIGIVSFIFILYTNMKNSLVFFNSTYKFYFSLASISILSYGLMKNLVGRETWYAFFIILPGLYYLPLLKSKK